MTNFDPRIIAFCCDQSGYPAADMAGTLKRNLPRNIEFVRVPCSGRIETIYLIKALEKGADGVLVFACYEKNCQFLRGNLRAKGRLSYAHKMLEKIGLEKERIEICHEYAPIFCPTLMPLVTSVQNPKSQFPNPK